MIKTLIRRLRPARTPASSDMPLPRGDAFDAFVAERCEGPLRGKVLDAFTAELAELLPGERELVELRLAAALNQRVRLQGARIPGEELRELLALAGEPGGPTTRKEVEAAAGAKPSKKKLQYLNLLLSHYDQVQGFGELVPFMARHREGERFDVRTMTVFLKHFAQLPHGTRRQVRDALYLTAKRLGSKEADKARRHRNPRAKDIILLAGAPSLEKTASAVSWRAYMLRAKGKATPKKLKLLDRLMRAIEKVDRPITRADARVSLRVGLTAGVPMMTAQMKGRWTWSPQDAKTGERMLERDLITAGVLGTQRLRYVRGPARKGFQRATVTPVVSVDRNEWVGAAARTEGLNNQEQATGRVSLTVCDLKAKGDGTLGAVIAPVLPLPAPLPPGLVRPLFEIEVRDARLAPVTEPLGTSLMKIARQMKLKRNAARALARRTKEDTRKKSKGKLPG